MGLKGIWKISSSMRHGVRVTLPRHVKFESSGSTGELRADATPAGALHIPYSDHCSGTWQVGKHAKPSASCNSIKDDHGHRDDHNGALHARFVVECAVSGNEDASRLEFLGLYDGERIAGVVTDGHGVEVADFLCTRLFTFWGPPSPRAGKESPPG